MKTLNELIPQNPGGKIVELKTEQECLKYFGKDELDKLNNSLPGTQKVEHFLPFFIEYTETDTFTVDTDVIYSDVAQVIRCQDLVFKGGSITSFVHLTIETTTTNLTSPSSTNNYQILVSGWTGNVGPAGKSGATGPNGTDGQSKSCENADPGLPGDPGGLGTDGGSGQNGLGTPLANFTLGSIKLAGTDLFTVSAQGGIGGNGGTGGDGGTGGAGGNGGNSSSTGCQCYTNGGAGGSGGPGGVGGRGGNAGNGSSTNQGMTITVATLADKTNISVNAIAGSAGQPGPGGSGGTGGSAGSGGSGTKHGNDGPGGARGATGNQGGNGNSGSNGTLPQITLSVVR